jgi:hypothetical protein
VHPILQAVGAEMAGDGIREQFRAELEFAIAPLREDNHANYEGAVKFAETAIKSAFALNGGALVALPALIALFKIDPQRVLLWVIIAGAVFVVGLISAAATAFLGYLSAMAAAHSIEAENDGGHIHCHLPAAVSAR